MRGFVTRSQFPKLVYYLSVISALLGTLQLGGQVTAGQNDAGSQHKVLFSKVYVQRQGEDLIDIQLMDDEVLVFDKAETYTLFDSAIKKPKKMIITAKHVVVEQPVVIRSFDISKDAEKPLPIVSFDLPAKTGTPAPNAPNCTPGSNGGPGMDGTDGKQGDTGIDAGLILLDIQSLEGNGTLTIDNTGGKGGTGQRGQVGGTGGTAGRGGNSVDHLFDCACGPQSAGQPGAAGHGGHGGRGGTGGNAQVVLLSASLKPVLESGKLLKIDLSGGLGGDPGTGGAGGIGGPGNEAGSGSVHCGNGGGIGSAKGPDLTGIINSDFGKGEPGLSAQIRYLPKSHWDTATP